MTDPAQYLATIPSPTRGVWFLVGGRFDHVILDHVITDARPADPSRKR